MAQRWNLVRCVCNLWIHFCLTENSKFDRWEGNPRIQKYLRTPVIQLNGSWQRLQDLGMTSMIMYDHGQPPMFFHGRASKIEHVSWKV